ncbi:MAG: HAMP domain-containing histidine kinase, partial [Candidatus Obscuribacterales bacterium]|nr:HAMP domain-containing histidine kinase [Candidatus Obscuribacterales bacterium]
AEERATVMNSLAQKMESPLRQAKLALIQFQEKEDGNLSERVLKQLKRSQHNIDRVLLLIDDLLTMETLETGRIGLELSECNAHSFSEEAISTVQSLAQKKMISIKNEVENCLIKADKARLIQTLINFLSNAIKFSPEQSNIVVSSSRNSQWIKIAVKDEGPGMDKETRERVFEKFFQAEGPEKKQGFGLGLAICSMIIQSHGGKLGVDSEVGKGSSFWFEIPIQI